MQLTAAIFDNNHTAAFNHMIPSQCMILSAQEGVNIKAIETHLRVLRETEYRVKSAHGVSPNFFKSTTNLLILGLLQGSAAVSIMWTMLSTLAFTVLSLRSPPACFDNPRIEVYTEQPGEAFVDDATLWTTSYATTCIVTIIARAAVKPKPGPESSSCAVDGST
jgi:hypothetical protein